MHVRVLTLNVWNSEGDRRRPEIINCALSTLDPDLVAFQEVMQTPQNNMLDRLLAGLDFQVTHQGDVQRYTPPFPDRYGGGALAASCGRGAGHARCRCHRCTLGHAGGCDGDPAARRDAVHRRDNSMAAGGGSRLREAAINLRWEDRVSDYPWRGLCWACSSATR
jgi:hypothetical protein